MKEAAYLGSEPHFSISIKLGIRDHCYVFAGCFTAGHLLNPDISATAE